MINRELEDLILISNLTCSSPDYWLASLEIPETNFIMFFAKTWLGSYTFFYHHTFYVSQHNAKRIHIFLDTLHCFTNKQTQLHTSGICCWFEQERNLFLFHSHKSSFTTELHQNVSRDATRASVS